MDTKIIRESLLEALNMLEEFLANEKNLMAIENAGKTMTTSIKEGGKIIACGNGGSMSDAMHFAEELSGKFRDERPALPALAISDPAHISCAANDYGFKNVFSRYIEALGKPGDVLLAISTSGNSKNILRAAEAAHEKGMKVVALTGNDGGSLAGKCDVEIRAPKAQWSDRVQEIHIKIIHILIQYIENSITET